MQPGSRRRRRRGPALRGLTRRRPVARALGRLRCLRRCRDARVVRGTAFYISGSAGVLLSIQPIASKKDTTPIPTKIKRTPAVLLMVRSYTPATHPGVHSYPGRGRIQARPGPIAPCLCLGSHVNAFPIRNEHSACPFRREVRSPAPPMSLRGDGWTRGRARVACCQRCTVLLALPPMVIAIADVRDLDRVGAGTAQTRADSPGGRPYPCFRPTSISLDQLDHPESSGHPTPSPLRPGNIPPPPRQSWLHAAAPRQLDFIPGPSTVLRREGFLRKMRGSIAFMP